MIIIKQKYIIKAIYMEDSITPKQSHQYRVGRAGYIENIEIGKPLAFTYEDGHGTLITSEIDDFHENDYGVWVYTLNSVYRFDYIYEKEIENEKNYFSKW